MERESNLPGITREAEEKQLARVIGIVEDNLRRTKEESDRLAGEIHELLEAYGAKDVEALSMIANMQVRYEEAKKSLERYKKARKKPYFGRIDLTDWQIGKKEVFYIGKVGITKNIVEQEVIDWRAPIASVYYENGLGTCSYSVRNEGTYEITLNRKRTYEIEADKLKDFYDSDVVANDELLTKYLAKNKKAVLGEIIATIQKEQNAIIRKSPKQNVIVQGAAGSGKTTVAMHRISYILYNYENEFRPEDFYIIGSNPVLLNYITSVLPDLDVYGVRQMTMEQLFVRLLYEEWDDREKKVKPLASKEDAAKGTLAWFQAVEAYCNRIEKQTIPMEDVLWQGVHQERGVRLLTAESIADYIKENPDISIQNKIAYLNKRLMAKVSNLISGKVITYTDKEKKEIRSRYRNYFGGKEWKGSVFELYQDFLEEQREKGYAVTMPQDAYDIYDFAALAYLYKRIKETQQVREASHVVVDEAQDFGMMAYVVLKYCMRGCTFTIMGDVSQNIHFGYGLNDWEVLKKVMLTGSKDQFLALRKSYRNTIEIANYAMEILKHGTFPIYPVEPIIRHGDEVSTRKCKNREQMALQTAERIKDWQKAGYETIAVICRDDKEAGKVQRELREKGIEVQELTEKAEFEAGVMVLPIAYTKGLEFDAVLLWNPNQEAYPQDDGHVKLLYVAATRALHELAVYYCGTLSEILASPAPRREQQVIPVEEVQEPQPRRQEVKAQEPQQRRPEVKAPEPQLCRPEVNAQELQPCRPEVNAQELQPRKPEVKIPEPQSRKSEVKAPESQPRRQEVKASESQSRKSEVKAQKPQPSKPGVETHETEKRKNIQDRKNEPPKKENVTVEKWGLSEKSNFLSGKKSVHEFGAIPSNDVLRPAGHAAIDGRIRWVQKHENGMELVSSYGILSIRPIAPELIRVTFGAEERRKEMQTEAGYAVRWNSRETRDVVQIWTEAIVMQIEKSSGAISFFDREKRLLLAERKMEPRQIERNGKRRVWNFFAWERNEKVAAKGFLKGERLPLKHTAKYISYGTKSKKFPCVMSDKGYGLLPVADNTVLCCNIPMYGPYLCMEETEVSDYFFFIGQNETELIKIYDIVIKNF